MQCLEAPYDLDKVVPNLLFGEELAISLFLSDNLQNVAAVCVLHYYAQTVSGIFEESLFVSNNVWMVDTCQDAHFVQGVLLFFAAELLHLYFFHCVNCIV